MINCRFILPFRGLNISFVLIGNRRRKKIILYTYTVRRICWDISVRCSKGIVLIFFSLTFLICSILSSLNGTCCLLKLIDFKIFPRVSSILIPQIFSVRIEGEIGLKCKFFIETVGLFFQEEHWKAVNGTTYRVFVRVNRICNPFADPELISIFYVFITKDQSRMIISIQ